jgi:hypothetical protein
MRIIPFRAVGPLTGPSSVKLGFSSMLSDATIYVGISIIIITQVILVRWL